jgi:arylformamidase
MKIVDISWPISPTMTTYKNEGAVQLSPIKTIAQDGVAKTTITLDSHTGTHVDTQAHFIKNGKNSTNLDLESLMGPCVVLDLSHITDVITADDLEAYDLQESDIVLIKTKNSTAPSDAPFNAHFIYLDVSAAQYLAEVEITALGFDYLGIERNQPQHPTHRLLFDADITIVEGLRLANIAEGEYFFVCLPLAIMQIDAVPARAVLIEGL